MSTITRLIGGMIAGTASTVVMSFAFASAKKMGALPHLPPAIIVRDISPQLKRRQRNSVAAIAHLAYGMGAGAAFVALVPRSWRNPVTGAAYGAAVWASGYEGWVPFLGILPPAHRDRRPRAISIFVAHIIYGASLGWLSKGTAR